MPIAKAIETIRNGRLDNVVSVVDAKRLADEFADGDRLLDKKMEEEDIESLLVQQIEFCSTLIINKTDLVTEKQIKKIHRFYVSRTLGRRRLSAGPRVDPLSQAD